jgi:sulfate adenylyltransferase subunit 1
VFAINKMDMVDWSASVFDALSAKVRELVASIGGEVHAIVPLAAKTGENVVFPATSAHWYDGPTLLDVLESDAILVPQVKSAFRLSVQSVAVSGHRRYYQGRIDSGTVKVGSKLVILPSLQTVTVDAIETFDGACLSAIAGQSVNIVLREDVDVSRGDVLADPKATITKDIVADICWLDHQPWQAATRYLLKHGTKTSVARIDDILFVRDMSGLAETTPATGLSLNDIASVRLKTQAALPADIFEGRTGLGAFILIDPVTNQTAAAGMIRGVG